MAARALLVRSLAACLRPIVLAVLKAGFGLRIHGAHHVPRRGGVVFAANHSSFIDPIVLDVVCPRPVTFLARQALFDVPWLGLVMRGMGTLPIDRQETEIGIRRAIRLLKRGGAVMIFPEGGRQISEELGQAKPGVGFLAGAAQVPIVPLFLAGTRQALPPGARRLKRAKIEVAFGPEIRYPDRRLSPEICERLAQQVTAGWQRLRDSLNTTQHYDSHDIKS